MGRRAGAGCRGRLHGAPEDANWAQKVPIMPLLCQLSTSYVLEMSSPTIEIKKPAQLPSKLKLNLDGSWAEILGLIAQIDISSA